MLLSALRQLKWAYVILLKRKLDAKYNKPLVQSHRIRQLYVKASIVACQTVLKTVWRCQERMSWLCNIANFSRGRSAYDLQVIHIGCSYWEEFDLSFSYAPSSSRTS